MMKINLKKINKVIDYIGNLLWAGIILVGVYGLLNSDSGMEALFDVNMILIGSLILFYGCYVEDLKKKNTELENKNYKLQLVLDMKELVISGLNANKELAETMTARSKEIGE